MYYFEYGDSPSQLSIYYEIIKDYRMKNRNIIIVIIIILISGSFFTSCGSSDSELEEALENGDVSSHDGFSVTVNGGSGDGSYFTGAHVNITADAALDGQEFDKWEVTSGDSATEIADASASSTTLTMTAGDVAVTATYKIQYALVVNFGSGGGSYFTGADVNITADAAPDGQEFDRWEVTSGDPALIIVDASASSTTLTMPAGDVAVTAIYKMQYALKVYSGTGSNNYAVGDVVAITAIKAPNDQEFDCWEVTSGDPALIIADASASSTTLRMPAYDVAVTATYKNLPEYELTVNKGSGDGDGYYFSGENVTITSGEAPPGMEFDYWEVTSGDPAPTIAEAKNAITTLTMSASVATVTAIYKDLPTYDLTVVNGIGDGSYLSGTPVIIEAGRAPDGEEFKAWVKISGGPEISDINASRTTLTMPANKVTVTATYRILPIANAGDDMAVGNYNLEITLDGSESSYAGTSELSYSWEIVSQPDDSIIEIEDDAFPRPSLTPDVAGEYVIKLIVSNGISNSDPDTVIVTVIPDVTDTFGMEFKYIQGGTFKMGDDDGDDREKPVHNVTLTPFYMQTTEVTQKQWTSVLDQATLVSIDIGDLSDRLSYFPGNPTNPMEQVSWDDVKNFIGILNELGEVTYRLPTEAEWEYACRSGSTTKYANGDDESDLALMGWHVDNSDGTTHPVAEKYPNAWGLFDMHGNVLEWCEDRFGSYLPENVTDPVGPSTGTGRVSRGGSWRNNASDCRSAIRYSVSPGGRVDSVGFRLVRTP